MANWCSNRIDFEGNPEIIEQIQQLFETMAEKEKQDSEGQLPDFITTVDDGYFFGIDWHNEDTGVFTYETKWSPNLAIVQNIAEHYKVNFALEYAELDCMVYGRAIYEKGTLTDICLEAEDFETYHYNEITDTYHFEGETYESDYEILHTLLERKVTKRNY